MQLSRDEHLAERLALIAERTAGRAVPADHVLRQLGRLGEITGPVKDLDGGRGGLPRFARVDVAVPAAGDPHELRRDRAVAVESGPLGELLDGLGHRGPPYTNELIDSLGHRGPPYTALALRFQRSLRLLAAAAAT